MRLINIEPYDKLGYRHLIRLTGGSVETAVFTPVDEIKTVDAVPVVRCRDCKHRHKSVMYGFVCDKADYPYDDSRKVFDGDWFCADGERKEVDSDG